MRLSWLASATLAGSTNAYWSVEPLCSFRRSLAGLSRLHLDFRCRLPSIWFYVERSPGGLRAIARALSPHCTRTPRRQRVCASFRIEYHRIIPQSCTILSRTQLRITLETTSSKLPPSLPPHATVLTHACRLPALLSSTPRLECLVFLIFRIRRCSLSLFLPTAWRGLIVAATGVECRQRMRPAMRARSSLPPSCPALPKSYLLQQRASLSS